MTRTNAQGKARGSRWMSLAAACSFAMGVASAAAQPANGTAIAEHRNAPAPQAAATYENDAVGFTPEGRPFRGKPDAPLTLVEYTDFACPFCALHFQRTLPTLIERYVQTGRLKLVIENLPLASLHPAAARAAAAALCVGEQGAPRYWRMHDALFREQPKWTSMSDPAPFLAQAAKATGADAARYAQCVASGRHDAGIQRSVAAAGALGFTGTPTFQFVVGNGGKTYSLVGAQPMEVFGEWIDALLAGKEPAEANAQATAKPELPFWATREGLAPDPAHPGMTKAGDRYKGNPNARLVLVEFADFECPACQRHALATQPVLDQRFVDTGEVMWIVKHFPLGVHRRAPAAAAAAECAGEQGRFFAMHHALFERTDAWSSAADADVALASIAASIGVEPKRFATCLASRKPLEHVLRDLYDGQAAGVKTIPAFILLHEGSGQMMTGARTPEQFAATLQQQLDDVRTRESAKAAMAGH